MRSSCRATAPTLFPLLRISSTTSVLYSAENARRFRFAMTHSYRTFVRSGVSTKPRQAQGTVCGSAHDAKPSASASEEGEINMAYWNSMNRPGFAGGSIPWEDWSHGKEARAPAILGGHAHDEGLGLGRDRRPPRARGRDRAPAGSEPTLVPADHGLGLHDHQDALPVRSNPREADPEGSIDRNASRSWRRA